MMNLNRLYLRLPILLALFALFAFMALSCAGNDDDDNDGDDDDTQPDDDGGDDDGEAIFQVGAARVDVSPAPGHSLKLGGYGMVFLSESLCRWSSGVSHDPLYASAIVFDDGLSEPIILINYDMVGMITTDIVRIQQDLADELDISPDRVVVSASHTHHSPDTVGIYGVLVPPISGRDEVYINDIIAGGVEAGVMAYDARVPATVAFATGSEARMHYNSNNVLDRRAITDHTMTLLAARNKNGEIIATLMNWGCHPMVMGPQNLETSSDFLGPYYRYMDEEVGGVNIFVNGPLGASVHPKNPMDPWPYTGRDWGTWEDVDRFGRVLADDAKILISESVRAEDTTLRLRTTTVRVKVQNIFFAYIGKSGIVPRDVPDYGEEGESYATAFSIGPVRFATIPGELVPDIGLELREIMGSEHQFLINLGMDWVGYIITPAQYRHIAYIYNALLSPGPDTGVALVGAYREIWSNWP